MLSTTPTAQALAPDALPPPCPKHPEGLPGHYWVLEPSAGRIITRGHCKRCGLVKDFFTHSEDAARHKAAAQGRSLFSYLTHQRRTRATAPADLAASNPDLPEDQPEPLLTEEEELLFS